MTPEKGEGKEGVIKMKVREWERGGSGREGGRGRSRD